MGDDTKVNKRKRVKKKFASFSDRLHHLYGKEAKGYTLRGNPKHEDGMNFEKRKCTDILCLILFWAMLAGKGFFFYYGYSGGDLNKVLCGTNGAGNICGVGAYEDYPLVYFSNISTNAATELLDVDQIFKTAMCVSECPTGGNVTCMPDSNFKNTTLRLPYQQCNNPQSYQRMENQTVLSYVTQDVLGYCIVRNITSNNTRTNLSLNEQQGLLYILEAFNSTVSTSVYTQLNAVQASIIVSMVTGFIYSAFLLYLLSHFADKVAWLCLMILMIFFAGGSGLMFKMEANTHDAVAGNANSQRVFGASAYAMYWIGYWLEFGAISFAILGALYFCIIFRNFKHIKTAIQVIDAAADFVVEHRRLIFVPLFYFIVNLALAITCLINIVNVTSLNKIETKQTYTGGAYYKVMTWEIQNVGIIAYEIFALTWFSLWINLSCQFTIMFSTSTYYFNSDEHRVGQAEVGLALKMTHINHMGTVAFGSAVLVWLDFIKFWFMWPAKRMSNFGKMNCLCRCIVTCSDCQLYCCEKLCDYMGTESMTYIAITGDNFCEGAWKGFMMQVRYMLEFQYSMRVISIFSFALKLIIILANVMTFLCLTELIIDDGKTLNSYTAVVFLNLVLTYITASMFMTFFETVSYSLLMCLSVDNDLHGVLEFGPSPFHEIVHQVKKNNKQRGGFSKSAKESEDLREHAANQSVIDVGENEDLF